MPTQQRNHGAVSLPGGVLLDKGPWRAEVLPEFGCNLIRLEWNGKGLLSTPTSLDALRQTPELYGTPLLFPPNRTRNGLFRFDGTAYQLPVNEPAAGNHIHGFFTIAPFSVENKSANWLTACCHNPAEGPGSSFPFAFTLRVTVRVEETGVFHQTEIQNTGACAMPVLLGFHTTFAEPERFSVPLGARWETDGRHLPTGRMLPLNEAEQAWTRGATPKGAVGGFFTAAGHTARIGSMSYTVSDNFTQWILYNGKGGKGYLCVEPQSGPVNGLNLPSGCLRLEAGETVRFQIVPNTILRLRCPFLKLTCVDVDSYICLQVCGKC